MQAGSLGSSNPHSQLQNETQPQAPQLVKRPSHVTSATPAKKITFFKSGDVQFGGVRMAIHRRSFKSFNALLDDLSQKVPLPFGVRTVTTPRGIHSINCLDQLEDGGCYLCSDRRPVKPINMEAAGKRPAVWHHSQSHNIRRKPSRPEDGPAPHSGHRYHRHPRRIVLVKNNDPAVRRSIILSRRTARSLRVFMDEISELMQCHIRKLYTLDGRRIDSIQSLVQCPSVLVCVGREPFRPLLVESLRKSSDEKLPGLGTRSRSSTNSEGQDSKKNVNFGLETKKSIIHPRWDSSNRSTRFSLSSEKSCHNGLNMSPGNSGCVGSCPHAKERMMNDDIEKRVLVNKDGSLSVEMKVRFRLLNDETLQWSTEIKKSAANVSDCCSGKGDEPCFLPQGKSESCSEPESASQCEAELSRTHLDESHCQNCCNHCQEYDIWKNPMHGDVAAVRDIRSCSSSSGCSRKIVCKKESVNSMHTISRSSEEYTEHVVEKATCFQQTVEDGDTRVEYCTISRCCSRSGACAASATSKSGTSNEEHCEGTDNDDTRPHTAGSVESKGSHKDRVSFKITQVSEERPGSAISNSSKVLESLKEDLDDDDDDLPPSVSRASLRSQKHNAEDYRAVESVTSNGSANNPAAMYQLLPRPPSKASVCSACSLKLQRASKTVSPSPDVLDVEVAQEESDERVDGTTSAAPAVSDISSGSRKSHRCHCGAASPQSVASEMQNGGVAEGEEENRAVSTLSKCSAASEASRKSQQSTRASRISRNSLKCQHCNGCDRKSTPVSTASKSPAPVDFNEAEEEAGPRSVSVVSARTNTSMKSNRSECTALKGADTPVSEISEKQDEEKARDRAVSSMSVKSNASSSSVRSKKHVCNVCGRSTAGSRASCNPGEDGIEGGAVSTLSVKTNTSAKSRSGGPSNPESVASENANGQDLEEAPEDTEGRAASAVSANTHASAEPRKSHSSSCNVSERAETPRSNISESAVDENAEGQVEETNDKADSVVSVRTNVSAKSGRSKQSEGNVSERAVTPEFVTSDNPCDEAAAPEATTERAASSMSKITTASAKSKASTKYQCGASEGGSVKSEKVKSGDTERTTSALSAKTRASAVSRNSNKSKCSASGGARTPESVVSESPTGDNGHAEKADSSGARASTKRDSADNELEVNDSRACSTLSVDTKASSRSKKSGKCGCGASERGGTPASDTAAETQGMTSAMSVRSKVSAKSQHGASERALTPTSTVTISIGLPEEQAAGDMDERAGSAVCENSQCSVQSVKLNSKSDRNTVLEPVEGNHDISERAASPASTASLMLPGSEPEVASIKSASTINSRKHKLERHLNVDNDSMPSVMSKSSASTTKKKSPAKHSRPASKVSSVSICVQKDTAHEDAEKSCNGMQNGDMTLSDQDEKASSICSKCLSKATADDAISTATSTPASSASARSASGKSDIKDQVTTAAKGRPKNNLCNGSPHLQVKRQTRKSETGSDKRSVNSLKTKSSMKAPKTDLKVEGTASLNSNSQHCPSPPKGTPKKRPNLLLGASGDSILSHSLSAADLLRENAANTRPATGRSKSSVSSKTCNGVLEAKDRGTSIKDNKSDRSSKCRHKKSDGSQQKQEGEISGILPCSLPNASPTEVVNEWLKKIPSDGSMYEMGDDYQENCEGTEIQQSQAESVVEQKESMELTDDVGKGEGLNEEENEHHEEAEQAKEENDESCTEEPTEPKLPDAEDLYASDPKCPKTETLPKNCHSSVQVMKILLSSKLNRCNSLPEVSPVYGRKLSSSAQGLLDCLAQLQLVGLGPAGIEGNNKKYQEVMNILQSLWLSEPSDSQQAKHKNNFKNHHKEDDEYNPRSSSGVDVSSSSAGSGKSLCAVDQVQKMGSAQGRVTPVMEQDTQQELQEEPEVNEGKEGSPVSSPKPALDEEVPDEISDVATPDIASRVQGSPSNEEAEIDKKKCNEEEGPASDEIIRSNEIPDVIEAPSSSNKSSGNDSNDLKSSGQKDVNSGTPPFVEKAQLTKRVSQDPDPVWVLNLLRKIEKQFMTHYVNAMTEFKVRWDLDDSVMLDTMINELRDEVQKRIQASIDRELKKIQSRAGRSPRPPMQNMSRESTLQTEQRRRRLKVMRNKSINPSVSISEGNFTATVTDYSDQRSEDEYCPCDTCMKKKMASRVVEPEFVQPAPVLMAFDLRKILQMKQQPANNQKVQEKTDEAKGNGNQDENENLEAVDEEAEEENEEEEQGRDAKAANEEAQTEKEEENKVANEQDMLEETAEDDCAVEEVEGGGAVEQGCDSEVAENEELVESQNEDTRGDDGDHTAEAGENCEEVDAAEEGSTVEEGEANEGAEEGNEAFETSETGEVNTADKGESTGDEAAETAEDAADNQVSKEDNEAEGEAQSNKGENPGEEKEDVEQEVPEGESAGAEAEGNEEGCTQSQDAEAEEEDVDKTATEDKDGAVEEEDATAADDHKQGTDEEDREKSGQDGEEESENQLARQMTKSSIMSQQGSVDDSVELETEAGNT
ncbi:retinitis pigmentosa 1-like 1 protein [Megalops cyprinoides]|uniref:retinitis pigmentosa 1-like 1 protein n=1 Tax=Megalops cyprinoides TaxID=118141 RepID=UPI00186439EF|nr:retinitis pigmentosa 1-like 1 protein [Megalops cyprinoides]